MIKEYKRWQEENVKKSLQDQCVVAISGARQTGKTALARQIINKNDIFHTLDDRSTLSLVKQDPRELVKNCQETIIIDEVQKVPELISEIKIAVNNDNRKGQYLLTGSTNLQILSTAPNSLDGYISHIRLRPLTMGEAMGKKPVFLARAFAGDFPVQIKGYDREVIFDLAFCGRYPEVLQIISDNERRSWYSNYITNLIKKDLKDIENIKRQYALLNLIKISADWSGKYMDNVKINSQMNQMNLTKPTLKIYINILEQMFIYEKLYPWLHIDYKYISKKPKFYATDTGLMTSILNWQKKDIPQGSSRAEKLMETFVFQELAAQVDLNQDYHLYQYRDYKEHEIDFLVEKENEGLIGIEVKSSNYVSENDFAPQIWFRDNIIQSKIPYTGIVLYSGENTWSFGNDMLAVPIAALWTE
jgi:predicted AAA+ superfamily ATPase